MNYFTEVWDKLSTLTGTALWVYVIAQIAGITNTVLAVISGQVKKKTSALILQMAMNSLMMASEILMGSWTAVPVCVVAIAVSLAIYFYQNKNRKLPAWVIAISAAAFLVLTVPSYPGVGDLIAGKTDFSGFVETVKGLGWQGAVAETLPVIGAMLLLWGLGSKSTTVYRVALLLNSMVWLIHDIYTMNFGLATTHIFMGTSFVIGIIRLDLLAKRKAKGKKQ